MDFIALPFGVALLAVAGLDIVGRVDHPGRWRQVACLAPAQNALDPVKLLHPDLAQRVDGGDLPHPVRRLLCHSTEQVMAILADLLG
jgi:hypothetical protein